MSPRQWKADQEERIRARDQASEGKRQQTIAKAEEAIDQFYKEYNAKKERSIADNKYVQPSLTHSCMPTNMGYIGERRKNTNPL